MRNFVAMCFAITAMLAASLTPAAAKGFYTGVYGGANWNDVVSFPGVDEETGVVIGGVVGTSVTAVPGLRVEADMSFRQNDVNVFKFVEASHDTFALMANVVYDVPVKLGPVTPYVLGGVGYASTEATFENVSLLKLENSGLAWQLGAGLNTDIADGVTFGVGYRYFSGPELEVLGTELSDGSNHSLVASVNFKFD